MKRLLCTSWFLLFAACASQPPIERVEIPKRAPIHVESPAERTGQNSIVPVDEAATQAFLDAELERRAAEEPIKEPEPPRTVYVRDPYYYGGYDAPYYRHAWHDRYGYPRHYRRHRFDLGHTLFGAGLGAIIGHQSGHRDRGAAIGAGVGLLLDLADTHRRH